MKKLFSVLLVTLLVLSLSAAAFAASLDATDKVEIVAGEQAAGSATVYSGTYTNWDGTATDTTKDDAFVYNDTTATAKQETDVWVRAKAAGQIDATVPLLVVISTDIDGVTVAKTPTNYKIVNYSTLNMKVSSIKIEAQKGWTVLTQDPEADDTDGSVTTRMNTGATKDNNNIAVSLKGVVLNGTLDTGLTTFTMDGANTGATDELDLDMQVRTSKLNFVTYVDDDDTNNINKAVHAVKISYTLAQNETPSGEAITLDKAIPVT